MQFKWEHALTSQPAEETPFLLHVPHDIVFCAASKMKWFITAAEYSLSLASSFFFYTMGVYGNLQALPLSLKWPLQEEVGNFRKWITKLRAFCYMRGGERTMFCEYTCLTLYNWIMRLKVWWWVSVPNHRTVLNDMAAGMKCFPHTVALGKLYLTGWNRTYAVFVCICVMCVKS